MNLDFTEEQEMLRTMARDFGQKECPKTVVKELEESELGYSPEMWKKMAELGWLGLVFPEKYGGTDGTFMDLMVIAEEMGRNILPTPFFSTVIACGLPILAEGTDAQKDEYLPKIAEGNMIFALALIEPNGTYHATSVQVTATADGDDYVINGTKLFVADANVANRLLVVARTKDSANPKEGITLFIVDAKSDGITCNVVRTIGLDNQCEVVFHNVKVSKDSVLGQVDQGWSIVENMLLRAALTKCAEISGGAQACLEMTNAYVKDRVQYGMPIGANQAIWHFMADMWINTDTIRNISYEAAWNLQEGFPIAKRMVAASKAYASDTYKKITDVAVHTHGAIGTTRDHDIGLYYRRAKAAELAFGDADYWREIMAQEIGLVA